MHRHTRLGLLVLIAAAVSAAGLSSAFAATGWSPPTPLPSGDATSPAVAVNSAGAAVEGWIQPNSSGSSLVETASSADGHTWTPTVTLDQGTSVSVGLAANGVAVAGWQAGSALASLGVRAAVRQPAGSWSAPVTIASTGVHPQVGVDAAGDAAMVWTTSASVQVATLRAGGIWSAPVTLGTGSQPSLAINSTGTVVVTWSTGVHHILTSSATIGGTWSAAVDIGPGSAYKQVIRLGIGADRAGGALWVNSAGVDAATRAPSGTWSAATTIATGAVSAAGIAQDDTGDTVAVIIKRVDIGTDFVYSLYAARHTAGGTWPTPTLLATLPGPSAVVAGTPAGSVLIAYAANVLTSLPGQGFGPPASISSNGTAALASAAAGHALVVLSAGGQDFDTTGSVA